MGSPNPVPPTALVVGCGRAGSSLALTLARRGWRVSVADLAEARARALARGHGFSLRRTGPVDLLVLAVPDRSLRTAARRWAGSGLAPSLAVHLGGATPAGALEPLAARGWRTAKVHPVFAFPPEPAPLPRGVAFGIAAPAAGPLREARALVRSLGGRPIPIRPGADQAWHLASVMAGNVLHAQLAAAGTLLQEAAGMSASESAQVLAPLVSSALDNILRAGVAGGLTGPVARGDAVTIESHLQVLLKQCPEISVFYASSTALLINLLPPSRRAALRRRLGRAGILI